MCQFTGTISSSLNHLLSVMTRHNVLCSNQPFKMSLSSLLDAFPGSDLFVPVVGAMNTLCQTFLNGASLSLKLCDLSDRDRPVLSSFFWSAEGRRIVLLLNQSHFPYQTLSLCVFAHYDLNSSVRMSSSVKCLTESAWLSPHKLCVTVTCFYILFMFSFRFSPLSTV